jgi:protein disulfide-isomerase-like protein
VVAQHANVFVSFTAPWCGHCKTLKPTWRAYAAATPTLRDTVLANVDCTANPRLKQRFGIRGFPSLRLFVRGDDASSPPVAYSGARTAEAFTRFLRQHAGEPEATTTTTPPPTPPPLVLHYFPSRGRAEAIRLVLQQSGVAYTDATFDGADWPAVKAAGLAAGTLPFGQLPVLTYPPQSMHVGSSSSSSSKNEAPVHVAQSFAIMQQLGRAHQMYGGGDGATTASELERTRIDMLAHGVSDWRNKYTKLIYSPEFAAQRAAYVADELPRWAGFFEQMLLDAASSSNAQGASFTSRAVTWADLYAWDVLDNNVGLVGLPYFEARFPRLAAFHAAVRRLPRIAAYLASERRLPFPHGPSAFFGNEANPPLTY